MNPSNPEHRPYKAQHSRPQKKQGRALKIAGILLLVVVLLIGIAVCTVVGIILGMIGVLVGFFLLFWMPAQGLTLIGLGFISLGIGCLGNVLCIRFYGKWLPALLHGASRQLGKLSRRNREGQRNE